MSNAVKYSSKGKIIHVKYDRTSNDFQVSIRDEGMGMSSEELKHIFGRYFSIVKENRRYISGFCIGLYLSAVIIERHNWKIWVESEIDKGSTFYLAYRRN